MVCASAADMLWQNSGSLRQPRPRKLMNMQINPELRAFLSDLAANNDKTWFDANKDRYDEHWVGEAKGLIWALSPVMASLDPPHVSKAKVNGSIRRINRDVRFSRDKRPYDPKLHLIFYTGLHPQKSPAIHIVIRKDSVGVGAGQWSMNPSELQKYREAVSREKSCEEPVSAVDACNAHGISLTEETLKRVPSGFEPVTGHDTLLKRKGLVVISGERPIDDPMFSDASEFE